MAKGFITINQVPQDLRSKAADKLRGKLREMLANPFIPADQRAVLEGQVKEVAAWEAGKATVAELPKAPEPAEEPKPVKTAPPPIRNALVQLAPLAEKPAREPVHHSIEVTEDLSMLENGGEAPPKPVKKRKK